LLKPKLGINNPNNHAHLEQLRTPFCILHTSFKSENATNPFSKTAAANKQRSIFCGAVAGHRHRRIGDLYFLQSVVESENAVVYVKAVAFRGHELNEFTKM
jgi:hypothetical protein